MFRGYHANEMKDFESESEKEGDWIGIVFV